MLVKLIMYGFEKPLDIPDSKRPPKELTVRLYKPMPRFVKFTGDACSSVSADDIWLDVHFRLDE